MNETSTRRLILVVAVIVSVTVIGYFAFGGIGESLVYYWSPTEVLQAGDRAQGASIRLGGLVAPGSIQRDPDGLTLRFAVTDGENELPVYAEAVPPAMFRESIGVVVEGTMGADGEFKCNRLMVKHDNQYQAPGEGEAVNMKELMQSMQLDGDG